MEVGSKTQNLVVREEGRTYAELHKTVRGEGGKCPKLQIDGVEKGRNEEVILKIKRNGPMEMLVETLRHRKGIKVGGNIRKTRFTIKGLDQITSRKEALKKVADSETFNVGPLRPAYWGNRGPR